MRRRKSRGRRGKKRFIKSSKPNKIYRTRMKRLLT